MTIIFGPLLFGFAVLLLAACVVVAAWAFAVNFFNWQMWALLLGVAGTWILGYLIIRFDR